VERAVLEEVARQGYTESCTFAIRLALEEALNNAIQHGNRRDRRHKVKISYDVTDRCVALTVADEGQGFDPRAIPDPTADENLEKPCGRGIMLMRAYMDEVRFSDKGNEVRMVKHNR
jgi:serine/threonine-protein kinase RsbW